MIRFALAIAIAAHAADVNTLGWMAGCWAGEAGPIRFEEQWNKPAGGQMMGMARTLKQRRPVFSEFMRIDQKSGDAIFTPRIGTAEKPVPFKAIRQTETEIVFENPEHDFPQRIIYRKSGDGLFARIEGKDKGKDRGEDFPMKAVPCK